MSFWHKLISDPLKSAISAPGLIFRFEKPYQYNILTWVSYFFITVTCSIICIWALDDITKNDADFVIWNLYNVIRNGFDSITRKDFQGILMFFAIAFPAFGLIFTVLYTAGVLSALSINNSRSIATRERLWRYLLNQKMFYSDGQHYLIKEREAEIKEDENIIKEMNESIDYCIRESEKNKKKRND